MLLDLDHNQLHEVFTEWNTTDELNSFLIEITSNIFPYIDPETRSTSGGFDC